ncbi:MAG: extracellular solute-binding protein [Halanaerobiales bacterium]
MIRKALIFTGILLLTMAIGVTVSAETNLTIVENAVRDGKSADTLEWHDEVLPRFEKYMKEKGEDVNVEVVETGVPDEDFKSRLIFDLKAGQGADIIALDQFWAPEFVDGGLLEPLNHFSEDWDEWEDWDQFYTGVRDMFKIDDEVYGIMNGTDLRPIFYNVELFKEAGIENAENWQPESWEDIYEAARTIREELDGVTPLQVNAGEQMGEATTMQGFYMVLLGTGERLYDYDRGKWLGASQGLYDTLKFYEKVYVEENLGDGELQVQSGARDRTFELFQDEKIAILAEGIYFWESVIAPGASWGMEDRDEKISWAKMPAKKPGSGIRDQDYVTISGGGGYVPNPNTDHPELALELLYFLNNYESKVDYWKIKGPRIPARKDVAEHDVIAENEFAKELTDELADLTVERPGFKEYPDVSREAQIMTGEVATGRKTPEEAMRSFKEAVQSIVGEDNVYDTYFNN